MTTKTVLIGLDGGTFKLFDPFMNQGVMPFLAEFADTGVRATLRTIIPPLTPPAWTSLMTGRSPGHHGIFDFFQRDSPDSRHIRFAFSRDVTAETIWSMANRHGKRVTVLNFPLMFPAPEIDGNLVPGWLPWKQLRLGCRPEGLFDRLKALPEFSARDLVVDMGMEAKALEGCAPDEWEAWIELHIRRDQQWLQVARALMTEDPCELTAVLFDGLDKLQHLLWRYLDPSSLGRPLEPWEAGVRDQCLDYYRKLDAVLAEIVDLAGPGATVIMASDHGFGAQTGTFFLNSWLEQRGDLVWADDDTPSASRERQLGIDQLARHVFLLDWDRTKAYAPTPSSNGIHIVVARKEGDPGVPEAEYVQFRDQLKGDLLAFRDPATGRQVVEQVWTREEAFEGPHVALAPDLTLQLHDRGLISILASETAYQARPEPSGTHWPEGFFLARGPEIRQGVDLPELSILDVAPLTLYSLGLPVPEDLEGTIPVQAMRSGVLAKRPVQVESSAAASPEPEPDQDIAPTLDEESQAEILARLRALGYL